MFSIRILIAFIALCVGGNSLFAQSDEDCFMCHEDKELEKGTDLEGDYGEW